MNKYFVLCLLVIKGIVGYGQQVPFYNHNIINPFIFNPAMAGASGEVNAYLVRNQRFTAFNGASVNNYLTIDGSILKDRGGLGFQVSHQVHGLQQQLSSSVSYSYKLRFRQKYSDLRFGISAGLLDNRIDLASINVADANDPYLVGLRPNAPAFDMNAGLSYRWKALRIGFAVPQLVGNKVTFSKDNARGYYRLARHMMLTAEYDFTLSKQVILKPYALIRYVPGAPLQYDLTAHLDHSKIGWASLTYKSDYSVQANIGFRVASQFKVGYSYEYLVGSMKHYSTGAHHEIMLGFTFSSKGKETVKIVEKTVEVEKVVEVEKIVENEETKKENDQLKKRNKELEELLLKTLAEKEKLQEDKEKLEQEPKPVVVPEKTTDKDSVPPNVETEAPLPYAKGYRFMEMDLSDSPNGFYVISGVFSSKRNAESALQTTLKNYSDAYLVVNKKNGFYYVVLLYTLDQGEAEKVFKRYKRGANHDAWILNYRPDGQ